MKFFELFKSLNIIKDLGGTIEDWNYEKLNETDINIKLYKRKNKKL